eukprot:Skav207123  [mRNA]  locus=scaffold1369:195247:232903:- [translate_table: standard]
MGPYIFIALLAQAWIASADQLEAALSSNDECTGETCAFNALQTRQRTDSMDYPEEAPSAEQEAQAAQVGPFVVCDPLCHDGAELAPAPAASDSLGSSYNGRYIRHYTQNCWYGCGRHAGSCPGFCGSGNACCRWRAHHDPPECRGVRSWPVIHWHTCVSPPHAAPSYSGGGGGGGTGGNCNARSMGGTMTVYHQTGCDIGPLILKEGFHLGKVGWCGGGIYFAMSPKATQTKAVGPDSHKGFMIEAQVSIGQVAHADDKCKMNGKQMNSGSVHGDGLDSVMFDPGAAWHRCFPPNRTPGSAHNEREGWYQVDPVVKGLPVNAASNGV